MLLEELEDEGPAVVEPPTSSVELTAGLSSFAFPFGSAVVVVVAGGEDNDSVG